MCRMTNDNTSDDAPVVIELPEDVYVFTELDHLDLPSANETGDQTGGMGPL